jgi:hypothetical protein
VQTKTLRHGVTAIAILAVLSLAMGCTDKDKLSPQANAAATKAAGADPRAIVLGIKPEGAAMKITAETSATKSTLTQEQEATAMPLPGQVNDHSTLAPNASQKAAPAPPVPR